MSSVTVRNIPEATHRALKLRASWGKTGKCSALPRFQA